MDPLTTEEVTAWLERHKKGHTYYLDEIDRMWATILDREQERDELQRKLANMTQQRDDCERELERHATDRVNQSRELLEAAKAKLKDCRENGDCADAALMPGECCSDECAALYFAIEKAEAPPTPDRNAMKLAAPVQEGERGTE